MAYSEDLRWKVVEFVEQGHTKAEARRVFGVRENTIRDWIRLKSTTGSLQKRELNRTFRTIDPEKLTAYVEKHPDAYLEEIAAEFGCSDEGIRVALKKLKITRKKRQTSSGNVMRSSGRPDFNVRYRYTNRSHVGSRGAVSSFCWIHVVQLPFISANCNMFFTKI